MNAEPSRKAVRVLFLFLDGVGIGGTDPAVNPLFAARLPVLRSLLGGLPSLRQRQMKTSRAIVLPLDATLGVKGLPQSGTGQASLLGGFNAARAAGHHFGPFPPLSVRSKVEQRNIFRRVLATGLTPCFANAFPERFFAYVKEHGMRLSMTTLSCSFCNLPLRQETELREARAVSADITNEGWGEMGYADMPIISLGEAGRRLISLSACHHFTLFEYWKTDFAGHARNMAESIAVLERFDGMLDGIVAAPEMRHTLVILSSDHGNLEDLSVKTHTRNPVPLVIFGAQHQRFAEKILSRTRPNLSHVVPAIMEVLTGV